MARPRKYKQPDESGDAPLVIPAPTKYEPIGKPVRELSRDVIESVALLVANGCAVNVAAQALGINHNTAKGWGQIGREHEELGIESIYTEWNHHIQVAKSQIERNLIQGIITHGATDWRALAFIAERKFPARWGTKQMEKQLTEGPDTAGLSTGALLQMIEDAKTAQAAKVPTLTLSPSDLTQNSQGEDGTSSGVLNVTSSATTVKE